MAILLEFNYGKKLGLPGYSSHNFGVSMKAEVNDPESIPEEAERVYSLLQQSVDSQIANPGLVSFENESPSQAQPTANGTKADPDKWNCTIRQRALIVGVLERNGLELDAADDLANELHGKPMSELNRPETSGVITVVLDRWGRKEFANHRRNGS